MHARTGRRPPHQEEKLRPLWPGPIAEEIGSLPTLIGALSGVPSRNAHQPPMGVEANSGNACE
jgi:hypothetical protein